MNVYQVLTTDHERLAAGVARLKGAGVGGEDGRRLLEDVRAALDDHTRAEDELLYARLAERAPDLIEAAREEHEQVDQLALALDEAEPGSAGWVERVEDLERALHAHVETEESRVFAVAHEVLSAEEADALGERLLRAEPDARRSFGIGEGARP